MLLHGAGPAGPVSSVFTLQLCLAILFGAVILGHAPAPCRALLGGTASMVCWELWRPRCLMLGIPYPRGGESDRFSEPHSHSHLQPLRKAKRRRQPDCTQQALCVQCWNCTGFLHDLSWRTTVRATATMFDPERLNSRFKIIQVRFIESRTTQAASCSPEP